MAEAFTGTPGIFVEIKDTVRSFSEILAGKHDSLPEQAFYMVGTIEDAIEKGKTLAIRSRIFAPPARVGRHYLIPDNPRTI